MKNGRIVLDFLLIIPFLLLLSTVFVIDNELAQGVITGKYFWFYASMGLASVSVLLSVIICKKTVYFTLWDGLILIFCACGLGITYYHNGTITTKWILLLLLLILYFYFRIFFTQNRKHLSILLLFFILTGLLEAIWGMRQLYGFSISQHGLFKTTGSFFNPGPYAGYLAVVFPLALSYYWIKDTGYMVQGKKAAGIITCVAILLVLPATMSRAAWLAAIVGSFVLAIPYLIREHRRFFRKGRLKPAVTVCIAIVLVCTALFGMYFLKKDSADGRALMWKVALQAIPKHPFGVGIGNFSGAYASEQATYFASGQASEQEELVAGSPEYGFNEYLQICLEWGIIPFILFLVIIAGSFYVAYKREQWGIFGSFAALLVFAFMSYPFSVLPFPIVAVFLLATAQSENNIKSYIRGWRIKSVSTAVIVMIGCLLTVFCLYNRYPTYEAHKKHKMAQMLYQTKSYEAAKKEYERLYSPLNDQFRFLFEYGHSLSYTGDYEKSNQILQQASRLSCDPMLYNIMGKNYQAMQKYPEAEAAFMKATQLVPSRLYPWYLLTKLYVEMGFPDKVRETAIIVLTKEPKVQSLAVREMREEIEKLIHLL